MAGASGVGPPASPLPCDWQTIVGDQPVIGATARQPVPNADVLRGDADLAWPYLTLFAQEFVHEYVPTAIADGTTNVPVHGRCCRISQLCIVTGQGAVTRSDIEAYVAGTFARAPKGYAKLVDMTTCVLARRPTDDLESVAPTRGVRLGGASRPVAMIVDTAFNLDMAVLVSRGSATAPSHLHQPRRRSRLAEGLCHSPRPPARELIAHPFAHPRLACIEQSG